MMQTQSTENEARDRDGAVQRFLERYAQALTAGDGKTIATMWEVPALVLHDQSALAVSTSEEVEKFFNAAVTQYRAQGIAATRADVTSIAWLSGRIAMVEVRWPYLDASGREIGNAETSTYTLRLDDRGEPRVRVAIMHGPTTH
jgi:ketosteroid isomerase-like protein